MALLAFFTVVFLALLALLLGGRVCPDGAIVADGKSVTIAVLEAEAVPSFSPLGVKVILRDWCRSICCALGLCG